jgi:hypothetical protein
VAALVERDGGVLDRLDYCEEGWAGARPEAARVVGYWRATYTPDAAKKSPLLGDDDLVDLFEELGGAVEPRQHAFRYLLALLLIRRRVLKQAGHKPGALLVVRKAADTPIEVVDPGMDERAIADAMEQLGQIVATEPAGTGGA